MYQRTIAYRHLNGEVEGFKGTGFSQDTANFDANRQIMRKLKDFMFPPQEFHLDRVITTDKGLTPEELETIQRDWHTNARYSPLLNNQETPPAYAD